MKRIVQLSTLMLVLILTAFAGNDEPKKITVPDGKCVIYIIRPKSDFGMYRIVNKIDGIELKTTGGTEFVYSVVDPGKHEVYCKASTNEENLSLETQAGNSYFVVQEVSVPPFTMGVYNVSLKIEDNPKLIEKYLKKSDLSK